GKFPEEIHARQPEYDCNGIDISYGNRQSNERHHPNSSGFHFAQKPFEKRHSTVEINNTSQNQKYIFITVKSNGETKPLLNHMRKQKDRNGKCQRDPESLQEIRSMMTCMFVKSGRRTIRF